MQHVVPSGVVCFHSLVFFFKSYFISSFQNVFKCSFKWCQRLMKSLQSVLFPPESPWRDGNAVLSWPEPVVLGSNLWFLDDSRCLFSDSRCSEQSTISYLTQPQRLLRVLSYYLFITFEGSGFLDSCWNANSLLKRTLLRVLRWSVDFYAVLFDSGPHTK